MAENFLRTYLAGGFDPPDASSAPLPASAPETDPTVPCYRCDGAGVLRGRDCHACSGTGRTKPSDWHVRDSR